MGGPEKAKQIRSQSVICARGGDDRDHLSVPSGVRAQDQDQPLRPASSVGGGEGGGGW